MSNQSKTSSPTNAPVKEKVFEVRTTGDFMLLDPVSQIEFEPRVATATAKTAFVERRMKLGHLEEVK